MARFIKLESHDGLHAEYLDLESIVHVRLTHAAYKKVDKGTEVHIDFAGGATARLTGVDAADFLKQFEAHLARLHPTGLSGPGHSALSP
jgi:hypothetical protein